MESFDPYHQWLDIPPAEQPAHYYRLLGLRIFEADTARIQAEADHRMQRVRTFQLGKHSQASQKILNELASARVCLLEPLSKSRYDAALSEWLAARLPVPPPAAPIDAPPLLAAEVRALLPGEASALLPPDGLEPAQSGAPLASTESASPLGRRSYTGWLIIAVVLSFTGLLLLLLWRGPRRGTLDEATKHGPAPIDLSDGEKSGADLAGKTVTVPSEVVVQAEDGDVMLELDRAKIRGSTLKLVEGAATHWHSADDQIEWQFLIRKPGIFRVIVTYAADAASAGGNARLAMSGYSQPTPPEVTMPIRNTGGSAAFVSDPVTRMFRIDKAGRYTLTIAAAQKPADQLMTLRRVRLHRMPVR